MILLPWLGVVLSCGGGDPIDPVQAVLDGDFERARMAATDPQLTHALERLAATQPERSALREVEQRLLREDLDAALTDGRLDDAVALAKRGGGTARVVDALRAHDDPLWASELLAELGEAWAEEAEQLGIRGRYREGRPLPEAWTGVHVAMADAILRQLDNHYVIPPSWHDMHEAGLRRLRFLAADASARERFPTLGEAPFQSALDAPMGDASAPALGDWLQAVAEAGPASPVVAEWTDAVLASLDPWTQVVWPAEVATWSAHHQGVRHGVGLELEEIDGRVWISMANLGGPAWQAGLHQRDEVLAVRVEEDWIAMAEVPPDQDKARVAAALLTGAPGSDLALRVRREEVRELTLRRQAVPIPTVHGWSRRADNRYDLWIGKAPGIAYVHIEAFKPGTEDEFDNLIGPVHDEIRAMVLDLRHNRGGDMNAAVQIADRWIADGVLAELSGRNLPDLPTTDPSGQALVPWNHAVPGGVLEGVPTVVLVDGQTTSAAEVLAGSLQDRDAATVFGETTWGKGLSQVLEMHPEHGFGLQITNLAWALPSGRTVGQAGIEPDVPIEASEAERFAMRVLRARREAPRSHKDGSPMEYVGLRPRPELPPLSEDPEVLRSILHLRAMLLKTQRVHEGSSTH